MQHEKEAFGLMAVLLVVAMATSAVGCRRESGGSNSGDEDTILIGGAMAVTGIQGPLDAPAMEGIVLAVEEINEKGGINGKSWSSATWIPSPILRLLQKWLSSSLTRSRRNYHFI